MNKQELFKQADYTFQRGNRTLASKYLAELLAAYPNDEAAWMLSARVAELNGRKIECYQRVLKINPKNSEAWIGLQRIKSISPTLPKHHVEQSPWRVASPVKNILRSGIVMVAVILGLGTTTYAIARSNPESTVGKLILPATPTPLVGSLAADVAAQTRAQVNAQYPQYAPLLDILIGLAVKNADSGMDGAPQRPGAEITPFEGAGEEARVKLQEALPQAGALSSVTLNEQQLTSWLATEMKESPDLPFSDVQVFLRNDRIEIWAQVTGATNTTSALIVGALIPDTSSRLTVQLESMQIGRQVIPQVLVSQAEAWLNQWISGAVDQQVPGLRIMNINISNGLITISGMR